MRLQQHHYFAFFAASLVASAAVSCSLVNAPDDVLDDAAEGGTSSVGGGSQGGGGSQTGGSTQGGGGAQSGGGGVGGGGGCTPPLVLCGNDCVDLDTDAQHCGDCNSPCGAGQSCVQGDCACDNVAEIVCDGDCIDPTTSTDYCGATGDCVGPNSGKVCGVDSPPGDYCVQSTCVGNRELVTNGDFTADLNGWTVANNPINSGDTNCVFVVNAGVCESEGSNGPNARVMVQSVVIPAVLVDAHFSLSFAQEATQPLDPQNVQIIETGQGDAFRIDVVSQSGDQFSAPIQFELYAPDQSVGTLTSLVSVVDPVSGLLGFLQGQLGQTLRLRIGKVESNFPWDVRIDDVSLAVVGGD